MPDDVRSDWPTQAQIYDAVVRVDRRLVEALARQDEHRRRLDGLQEDVGKLDSRVDDLHTWRSLVRGALTLLSLAVTAALATGGAMVVQSMGD